jgi:hypothetical protein
MDVVYTAGSNINRSMLSSMDYIKNTTWWETEGMVLRLYFVRHLFHINADTTFLQHWNNLPKLKNELNHDG